MTTSTEHGRTTGSFGVATVLLVGAGVAVSLGVYGKVHDPAAAPAVHPRLLGHAADEGLADDGRRGAARRPAGDRAVDVGSPARGRYGPGRGSPLHRWSGSVAFVLTLPVAFHCMWALGFATTDSRVLVHGLAGCAFYGAYAAKMLGLRLHGLPGWALPVLGGTVLTSLVLRLAHRRPVVLHPVRSLRSPEGGWRWADRSACPADPCSTGAACAAVGGVVGFVGRQATARPRSRRRAHAQANAYGTTSRRRWQAARHGGPGPGRRGPDPHRTRRSC